VPVEITSTRDGTQIVQTTQAFQTKAPTSVVVDVTTTDGKGKTITTSANVPAAVVTDSAGVVTTSPLSNVAVAPGGIVVQPTVDRVTTTDTGGNPIVLSRPTAGGVYSTTNSRGGPVVVTYQPGGGTVSELMVYTSTLANGQRSTITSFANIPGPTNAGSDAGPAANPSQSNPSLQSGAILQSSYFAAAFAALISLAVGAVMML
jgi:hypothetical protein